MKANAKLAIRVAILTVGMVLTMIAASTQPVPAADGGPLPMCTPAEQKANPQRCGFFPTLNATPDSTVGASSDRG